MQFDGYFKHKETEAMFYYVARATVNEMAVKVAPLAKDSAWVIETNEISGYLDFLVKRCVSFGMEPPNALIHLSAPARAGEWPYRAARILKTVAHILVDEAPDGSPVWEAWPIKGHNSLTDKGFKK